MKKSLLTLLLSSSFILLFAQKHTEISIDLPALSYYNNALELTAEHQLNDRFSILLGASYKFKRRLSHKTGENIIYLEPDSTIVTESIYERYNSQYLDVFIEGRYYWTPKNGMDRFYVGLGLYGETLIHAEQDYPESRESGKLSANAPIGYKFVIKDKVSIDFGMNFLFGIQSYENPISGREFSNFAIDVLFNGRVGYRF